MKVLLSPSDLLVATFLVSSLALSATFLPTGTVCNEDGVELPDAALATADEPLHGASLAPPCTLLPSTASPGIALPSPPTGAAVSAVSCFRDIAAFDGVADFAAAASPAICVSGD